MGQEAGAEKRRIIVVCGPTASGKSTAAVELALQFGGEIVGADSMQIYAGLPIGTAALTPGEARGVPTHLMGNMPPEQAYSVAEYVAEAGQAIEDIARRGAVPIVCGGTGLYIQSLVEGTIFAPEAPDVALRARLEEEFEREGGEKMLERLAEKDPKYAASLHVADKKRIIRGLEQLGASGKTYAERAAASRPQNVPYDALCMGLCFEDRAQLYERIERRVDSMMAEGLLEEAQRVYENRESFATAAQAIGYKEFFEYFEGAANLGQCVEKLKQATRNYAKRQMTWFRRMESVQWVQAGREDTAEQLRRLAAEFLEK